jgi:DNA-binding MarR family transcriptional regulator
MHLARHDKLPSQKELADRLDVTPAAITVALKKIEQDGYVERTLGQDNRYNELRITEKGRELVKTTRQIFCDIDSSMFEGFSDEELDTYISCLEKLQANIRKQYERKENI